MTDFSDFEKAAEWEFPVPINYGPGRIREIAGLCRAQGVTNPLIVTDRGSSALPFVAELQDLLRTAGLRAGLFCQVAPNPTDENVAAGQEAFVAGGHDSVIAIGGGSGMDAGKAISLVAHNARDVWQFDFDNQPDSNLAAADFPPLFTIPTTAGTGAETESTAMLTDTQKRIKGCVWHPAQKPVAVILDPELTVALPKNLSAWTGCDALVHAIEAYSVPLNHPLCDGAALEGLRLIYPALPRVLAAPDDVAARGALLAGSCFAGVSFLKGLGLVHAISHMIGAEYDTQHGLTNAVILPVVLRFNRESIEPKLPAMAAAMGLGDARFETFMSAITDLLDLCDIPKSLAELGVKQADVPRLANKAFGDVATSTNPRKATVKDIAALIEQALTGARE